MRTFFCLVISTMSLLFATALMAENALLLESFEAGIDSVTLGDWGGNRVNEGGVALSVYTRTNAGDIYVTQGTNALKVDLTLYADWVLDFKITLSEEASSNVLWAAKSTDVARYILRYDLIFPGATEWMNNEVFLGGASYQLDNPDAANGGKATMSLALDLAVGLPETGPLVLRFADNFAATQTPFVGPLTVYVDNVRLVDTYAPGAKPVTTVLQGFEDANNPTGGAADYTASGGTSRTTYHSYAKTGPDDIRVTEGTKCLQVDYTGAGDWKADFTLPFTNTLLAQVLKLDLPAEQRPTLAELAFYTFRYDVTYPDRDENGQPSWQVTVPFAYDGSWLPYEQARIDAAVGQVQTVSFTLDQMPNWTLNGGEGAPLLVFVEQGDFSGASVLYYDNFRLIYTGPSAAAQPKITAIDLNAQGKVVITWTGLGVLQWTPKLVGPSWAAVPGATSGSPIDPPAGGVAFYRILAQ